VEYKRRVIDSILDEVFQELPAILLDGPKGVGKTTTASQRAKTIVNLENDNELALAQADPETLLRAPSPILLDEWQKAPNLWTAVKRAVDQDYSGGQFLLAGSTPHFPTHSGAGRIVALRMRPMSFAERGLETPTVSLRSLLEGAATIEGETSFTAFDYLREAGASGFPAFRNLTGTSLRAALDGYIERIINTDLKSLGLQTRSPQGLLDWLKAYAAAIATTASWESIRDAALGYGSQVPVKRTLIPYRDALTNLRILDPLPGWSPTRNHFAKVSLAEKHYLADPALALRLLGIDAASPNPNFGADPNFDKPLAGRIFEALTILSIRSYADAMGGNCYHFREQKGRREVDLMVDSGQGKVIAIEIKLSAAPSDSDLANLRWLKSQMGERLTDMVVVTTGKYAFRKDGIAFVPLALLGP
jgi:uncharacterized protein